MKLIETASLARYFSAMLAVVLVVSGAARAEPVFSFDATPGKLPKTVVPISYSIELRPDVESLALPGVEVIDIEVREPTARLTLNAVNTTFASVTVDDRAERADVALDAAAETATFTFAQPLAAGAHRLRIEFTARINKFDRGFFFVDYPTDSGVKRLLTSKLEPADARRIFPCWDEPAFKASFALSVRVPRHFLAVGNMPIVREEPLEPNLKIVTFAPTPKMSTYLFVLTVGELERITAEADGVTIGVVATTGKAAQGQFALDSAAKLLAWFNDYFGVKYPLPKLDLIAVPGGFGGAMENWGGITFFESRLLFDPATNPDSARRGIFSIIAHEMAHQWFGDLVTMAWWDNLWLNEGFATWMATKAAEQFYPQWQSWLNGYGAKQFAMALDARRTSHPIQQPVANESEAMIAFDAITYNKGQALIRMLENYLGEAAFRDGIRAYMAAHAYGNTTTADLWRALERAGHKPVTEIAASFTEQDGVPLISAETACNGDAQRLTLRQGRFVVAPARTAALPPRNWQIPVAVGKVRHGAIGRCRAAARARPKSRPDPAVRRSRSISATSVTTGSSTGRRAWPRWRRRCRRCRRQTASISSPTAGRWCRPAAPSRHPISPWSRMSASMTAARYGIRSSRYSPRSIVCRAIGPNARRCSAMSAPNCVPCSTGSAGTAAARATTTIPCCAAA